MDALTGNREVSPQEPNAITVDILQQKIKDLRTSISSLYNKELSNEQMIEQKKMLTNDFVEKQIAEVDGYKKIFKTERGSIYFVLNTGESMRVKKTNEGLAIQPICHKIFYVDTQQAEQLEQMMKGTFWQEDIIGVPISTVSLTEGVRPVEFGIINMPEINFSEEENILSIKGDNTGVFASGFHLGSVVSEIIK